MPNQHDERMDYKTEILNLRLSLLNLTEKVRAREQEVDRTLREVARIAYALRDGVAEMRADVDKMAAPEPESRAREGWKGREGRAAGRPGPKRYDALAALGL